MKNTVKKIIIITSYIEKKFDMKASISSEDLIICADGGYDIAASEGIRPHLVIGDLDSIKSSIPDDIKINRFNPEKDFTDLELALKTAAETDCRAVEIWGGMGGRLDHTIANIQLLSKYTASFDSLVMKDGQSLCFAVCGRNDLSVEIPASKNCYLSLFSLTEKCCGVCIDGVKYPLSDHTLVNTFPLGVSNEFTKEKAVLSLKNGTLLIVISEK